jgi:hypothetical protein
MWGKIQEHSNAGHDMPSSELLKIAFCSKLYLYEMLCSHGSVAEDNKSYGL